MTQRHISVVILREHKIQRHADNITAPNDADVLACEVTRVVLHDELLDCQGRTTVKIRVLILQC